MKAVGYVAVALMYVVALVAFATVLWDWLEARMDEAARKGPTWRYLETMGLLWRVK